MALTNISSLKRLHCLNQNRQLHSAILSIPSRALTLTLCHSQLMLGMLSLLGRSLLSSLVGFAAGFQTSLQQQALALITGSIDIQYA